MDFDKTKVYGDTSITDGLVVLVKAMDKIASVRVCPEQWASLILDPKKSQTL